MRPAYARLARMQRRLALSSTLPLAISLASAVAAAQVPPAPPAPVAPPLKAPPGYYPPPVPPGSYAPGSVPPAPPGSYAPGSAPPAPPGAYVPPSGDDYGAYGYGYEPPPPPPPPPPPKPLRWSVRYDPFDLIQRRLTLQAEVAVYKFFALEVDPSWIFGSPYSGIDGKGYAITGSAVFYLLGEAFRGFWLKAQAGYESSTATLTNPNDPSDVSQPQQVASAVLGVLFGDTWVIPRSGGFALSGGIGFGYATANKVTLTTNGSVLAPPAQATLYDGFDKFRLLGTLGLGVAF